MAFQHSLMSYSGQAAFASDQKFAVHVHTPGADLVRPPGAALPPLVSAARVGPRDHPVQQRGLQTGRLRLGEVERPTSPQLASAGASSCSNLKLNRLLKMRIGIKGSSGSRTSYKHMSVYSCHVMTVSCVTSVTRVPRAWPGAQVEEGRGQITWSVEENHLVCSANEVQSVLL